MAGTRLLPYKFFAYNRLRSCCAQARSGDSDRKHNAEATFANRAGPRLPTTGVDWTCPPTGSCSKIRKHYVMKDYIRIRVGRTGPTHTNITQKVVHDTTLSPPLVGM
ncbi:hypothetical protein H2199_008900 [Coniosporium tulheliwenetii]|uniref:Uncharacterized protein n=1 Tax=Coniosporium tulheliwenetii TaxID=3383036 RepID=A0ACC2YHD4_9PEZI|nr:hypothetical protein H2199_008900 [Cladosporium sp. JES 115]